MIANDANTRGREGDIHPDLMVVILAGGQGRRMGGGKPLRRVDGRTLISLALDKARTWSPRVAVAVRSCDQVGTVNVPVILDAEGVCGPLGGLATALAFASRARASRLLTLPCDMPSLPDDLAGRLCEAMVPGVGAATAACAGQLHPICSAWDVGVQGELRAYTASGGSSVRGFAQTVGARRIEWDSRTAAAFENLNTPAELLFGRAETRRGEPWERDF